MKSLKFTLLLFLAFANGAIAQLNGTYTIGGASPDYATIQAAASAVQSQGVSGPVLFNIRPGTYNESVTIGLVNGVSNTNTITFKSENGDRTSVIISDTSSVNASTQTIYIFNTDFLIFRDLTIERTGTLANSIVITISANCNKVQFRNNIIRAAQTTSTAATKALVNVPLGFPGDSMLTFDDNKFEGGSIALNIIGQSPTQTMPFIQITDNTFDLNESRAIHIRNGRSAIISGNIINADQAATSFRGIYLWRVNDNSTVTENQIFNMTGGDAIFLDTCAGAVGNEGLIANNFISTRGATASRGITLNSCSSLRFYHNSVNMTGTGTGVNAAFNINNAGSSLLNVRNNIFMHTGGGLAVRAATNGLSALSVCNFNNLYVGASSVNLATSDTNNYATLAAWQAGTSLDANSVSGDPQFASVTDLHVGNAVVNNNGTPITAVTTDIDGQARSATTPDIGADEFTPLSDNIGLVGILLPNSLGGCGDSAVTFAVIIRNFGLDPQTGFPVKADITGDFTLSLTETYSQSLTTNEIDTVYFTQTLNTYAGGSIDVSFYTALTGDQNTNNDTLFGSYTYIGNPNAPVANPQTVCLTNIEITASVDSGNTIAWFSEPTGGNILFAGDIFRPAITGDTTFYAEARASGGNLGCLRITEIQPDDNPSDYIEIQNVSGGPLDATGWVVAASLDNTNINNVNANLWNLGFFNPGEVQFRTDNAADPNYWGSNLLFTGGNGSWAMIIDNLGNIVDFVVWDWPAADIIGMNTTINGFPITIGSEWSGDGYISCTGVGSNQRIGNTDNNDASDWGCDAISPGTQNTGIVYPFNSCGIGVCGSARVPVSVTVVPGITASLGNDTIVPSVFSITLDPGAGFTSYLWSTGDTSQTITVNVHDVYWVTVTGGPDSCSYTDSITISLNVGISSLIGLDEISFYPNPAKDRLIVTGNDKLLGSAIITITDLQGRVVSLNKIISTSGETTLDISALNDGIYFLHVSADGKTGTRKFVVLK